MIRRYEFGGRVTIADFHNALGAPIDIGVRQGHHFRGNFRYDTGVSPDANNLYAGTHFKLDVLIYKDVDPPMDHTHGINTYATVNPGIAPPITLPHNLPPPTFGVYSESAMTSYWGVWFGDSTGNLLPGTGLPENLPALQQWDQKVFWYSIDGSGYLMGEIDTLCQMSDPAAPAPPSKLRIGQ